MRMKAKNAEARIERIGTMNSKFVEQLNSLLDEGTVWDEVQGNKFLGDGNNGLWVAYIENVAVGFITAHRLQRFDKRQAEILLYEIGVHEEYRKRGIGKALIEKVKDWASEVGADEVWVLTNTSNDAAMALYTSAGGKQDVPGTTMFTYKIDR